MSNTYTCTFVLASPQHRWTHQCSATFLIFTSIIIIIYSYSYHCYITLHSLFKMLAALLTVLTWKRKVDSSHWAWSCWGLGGGSVVISLKMGCCCCWWYSLFAYLLLIFSNCLSFIKIPEKWIHTEFIKNVFLIRVMNKMIFLNLFSSAFSKFILLAGFYVCK